MPHLGQIIITLSDILVDCRRHTSILIHNHGTIFANSIALTRVTVARQHDGRRAVRTVEAVGRGVLRHQVSLSLLKKEGPGSWERPSFLLARLIRSSLLAHDANISFAPTSHRVLHLH